MIATLRRFIGFSRKNSTRDVVFRDLCCNAAWRDKELGNLTLARTRPNPSRCVREFRSRARGHAIRCAPGVAASSAAPSPPQYGRSVDRGPVGLAAAPGGGG